jgi:hypothetical protein
MDVERAASVRHIVGRRAVSHHVVVDDANAPARRSRRAGAGECQQCAENCSLTNARDIEADQRDRPLRPADGEQPRALRRLRCVRRGGEYGRVGHRVKSNLGGHTHRTGHGGIDT